VGGITQVGVRGFATPRSVHSEALVAGSNIIAADQVIENGHRWVLERVPDADNLYVTIDIDVLDPSLAPGTGTPEPGGLGYRQLRDILLGLPEKGRIVGFDIVEVNPLYDHAELTPQVAARLALDFLGAIFKKNRA
jgi:agmatinase